jgi:ribose transport system substrate-binding protein
MIGQDITKQQLKEGVSIMNNTAKAIALGAIAALSLAGCAAGPADSGSSSASGDLGDVAFLYHTLEFEFMVGIQTGTEECAAELPFNKTTILSAQGNSNTQLSQFQDQLAAGAKGIVFSPNVSAELVPAVEAANDAGVPVVTVDSLVADGELAGSVTFDNAGGGAVAADFIADALGDKGKVLELTGPQGAFHAELRHKGFIDQIGTYPDITVETRDAHFSADEALSITVDVLTDDPDYQAIFVHTDGMLRGVLSALEQLKLTPGKDVQVVGLDGTPEALDLIRDGSVAATVSADPIAMGCEAAQMMSTVLEGGKGSDVLVPATLVTADNVDDKELWGNKPLG